MKTIRRSLTILLLTIAATACGTSSILAPSCEEENNCPIQPGTGSIQPGTGSIQPGTGS